MPYVKTSFDLSPNDASLVDTDRHSAALVALFRQLGALAECCDRLFGELVVDAAKVSARIQKLAERTSKLAVKVDQIVDDVSLSTNNVESTLSSHKGLVRRCSVTDYKSRARRNLFTRQSRPETLLANYGRCYVSPVDVINDCDIYRTDGRRGSSIFSPTIVCLYERPVDDYLNLVGPSTIRRRNALGRSIKSLRPSNRTRSLSLPVSPTTPSSDACTQETTDAPSVSTDQPLDFVVSKPETAIVDIDVSGSYFRRQAAMVKQQLCSSTLQPLESSVEELGTAADLSRDRYSLASWRRTICDVSDLEVVFGELDLDLPPPSSVQLARDSSRSLSTLISIKSMKLDRSLPALSAAAIALPVSSSLNVGTTSSKHHRKLLIATHGSTSKKSSFCSWRQSLTSLLRGAVNRGKSTDLWATAQAAESCNSPAYQRSNRGGANPSFRRSHSLPRPFRSKVVVGARDLSSCTSGPSTVVKSRSLEGQLDDTPEIPDALLAGGRLRRSISMSRSKGDLIGSGGSRGRPQSMEVHIMTLDQFGRPTVSVGGSTRSDLMTQKVDEDDVDDEPEAVHVHVNIPDQPWTKPFANVKLRARNTRAASDKYQSSSGHWSGEQSASTAEGDRMSSTTSVTSYHVGDSAVSLSCDTTDRHTSSKPSDDGATLKAGSSNSTLTRDTSDDVIRRDVCLPPKSLASIIDGLLATCNSSNSSFENLLDRRFRFEAQLSTFKRKSQYDPTLTNANNSEHNDVMHKAPPPAPPRRLSTARCPVAEEMQTASAESVGNQSTEIEKLASLADRIAIALAAVDREAKTASSLPDTAVSKTKELTVDLASRKSNPTSSSLARGSLTSREAAALSLIVEGSDETDESCSSRTSENGNVFQDSASKDQTTASILQRTRSVSQSQGQGLVTIVSAAAAVRTTPGETMTSFKYFNDDPVDTESAVVNGTSTTSHAPDVVSVCSENDAASESPVPVSARLIISSPVAGRAFLVDNPYRRSMCCALLPAPTVDGSSGFVLDAADKEDDGDFPPPPASLVNNDVIMSTFTRDVPAGFPVTVQQSTKSGTIPSNYGRSWYDGVRHTDSGDVVITPADSERARPLSSATLRLPHSNTFTEYKVNSLPRSFLQNNGTDFRKSSLTTLSATLSGRSSHGTGIGRAQLNSVSDVPDNGNGSNPLASGVSHSMSRSFSASSAASAAARAEKPPRSRTGLLRRSSGSTVYNVPEQRRQRMNGTATGSGNQLIMTRLAAGKTRPASVTGAAAAASKGLRKPSSSLPSTTSTNLIRIATPSGDKLVTSLGNVGDETLPGSFHSPVSSMHSGTSDGCNSDDDVVPSTATLPPAQKLLPATLQYV